jgi:hypothetical protein
MFTRCCLLFWKKRGKEELWIAYVGTEGTSAKTVHERTCCLESPLGSVVQVDREAAESGVALVLLGEGS